MYRPRPSARRAAWLSLFCLWSAALAACGQAAPPVAATRHRAAAASQQPLLGRWQSVADPLSEVEITATRYLEKYQGKITSTSTYQLAPACGCPEQKPAALQNQRVLTTRSQPDGDCYCYLLQQLTPTTLRLANYGQGGIMTFKRLQP